MATRQPVILDDSCCELLGQIVHEYPNFPLISRRFHGKILEILSGNLLGEDWWSCGGDTSSGRGGEVAEEGVEGDVDDEDCEGG